jgi:hypothetical protein
MYARPEAHGPNVISPLDPELMPSEFLALGGPVAFDRAEAQEGLRAVIQSQIEELEALSAVFDPLDAQSRAEASLRAMAPADTAENKLLLRYQTASSSAFTRAVKTLESLQAARKKAEVAAEAAAITAQNAPVGPSEAGLRNELKRGGFPSYRALVENSYIRIDGRLHSCQKSSNDQWLLSGIDGWPGGASMTEVSRLETPPEPGV